MRRLWCVRYNTHHDQLLITAGSDARLLLHRAYSVSSEAVAVHSHANPNVNARLPSAPAGAGDSGSDDRSINASDVRCLRPSPLIDLGLA